MVGEVQDCCQLSNSACLQLGPHILYVSRFPGKEFKPESLNLTMKHLLKIMIWCCMARSEVGHCRWNCQCDQMHWYTAEVRGAISIALFQKAYPFCLKDDNEPCHLAKL